jgi:hypothetical protein
MVVFFFLDNRTLCCPISLILCCPISIPREYGGDSNSKCTYYIIGFSGPSIRRHIWIYKLQLKKTKTNHPRAFHCTFECRVFLFLPGLVVSWKDEFKKNNNNKFSVNSTFKKHNFLRLYIYIYIYKAKI